MQKVTKNFWQSLPKPFYVLAPLANVTDAAFRKLVAVVGKPHVLYTEFVSADGLCSAGRENLLLDLKYSEIERPIVAQLFTSNPEKMEVAAAFVASLGFDGIDINMGCPDRSVEKQGAGAALIKQPVLAQKIVAAAKRGAAGLPVSVKTRIGYSRKTLDEWLPMLLEMEPVAVAIHARTRKELSKVPAHWDVVAEAVEIRNKLKSSSLIIGNGDVLDRVDAEKKATQSGCDGVMLGRASFGNPWLFNEKPPSEEERLEIMKQHARMFEAILAGKKSFHYLRKHYRCYTKGMRGSNELRAKLMETNSSKEIEKVINDFVVESN